MRVYWDRSLGSDGNGMGMADNGSMRCRLGGKPPIGFAFDAIHYDEALGLAEKVVAGATVALSSGEVAQVQSYLGGYVVNNLTVAGPRASAS